MPREIPTLVVSDPPHGEIDVEAAATLLDLDVFATRLKANFPAPEVMFASERGQAADFAAALHETGFTVAQVRGSSLVALPWPEPISTLAIDTSSMRVTLGNDGLEINYDVDALGVFCRPAIDLSGRTTVDLGRAVASGHGPTIAKALEWTSNFDLYAAPGGLLRRISIVPSLLNVDGEQLVAELGRRFMNLRLDARLEGITPRAPFTAGEGAVGGPQRRGYSFGTPSLRDVLESISPELGEMTQYEFGSRLAYALSPLEGS